MLKIYNTEIGTNKFEEIKEFKKGAWINLVNPSENEIKKVCENIQIEEPQKEKTTKKKKQQKISPKTNFAIASYYKGTGLEEVTKKLEEYLDECNPKESNINCI